MADEKPEGKAPSPAKTPRATSRAVDVNALAQAIFVRLWSPDRGLKAGHVAEESFRAAEAFAVVAKRH